MIYTKWDAGWCRYEDEGEWGIGVSFYASSHFPTRLVYINLGAWRFWFGRATYRTLVNALAVMRRRRENA